MSSFIADIYGVSTTERKHRIEQMAERFGMEDKPEQTDWSAIPTVCARR